MIIKNCLICNKVFKTKPSLIKINKGKFCSSECYWESKKKKITYKCENCDKRFKDWVCQKRRFCSKGCVSPWNKGLSKEIDIRLNYIRPTQFKLGQLLGAKHPMWKGGITDDRRNWKYKQFIRQVWERDNYTCQLCKQQIGKLNVDHIKPWSLYPESRFDFSNVRTLCVDCHRKTSTYGKRVYNFVESVSGEEFRL